MTQQKSTMARNVYLFIPNIIDYIRLLVIVGSCYYMMTDYVKASLLYALCVALDFLDGPTARYLNQTSKFGAMLDGLTDAFSTVSLCMTLGYLYPQYMLFFQIFVGLTVFAFWFPYFGSVPEDARDSVVVFSPLLRYYVKSQWFVDVVYLGPEMFLLGMYLCHHAPGLAVSVGGYSIGLFDLLAWACAPFAILKVVILSLRALSGAMTAALTTDTVPAAQLVQQTFTNGHIKGDKLP